MRRIVDANEMTSLCRVRDTGNAAAIPFSEQAWLSRRRHLVEKGVDERGQTDARNSKEISQS
jgi:hypothetical protein